MPSYKLTYFDVPGRAECIRLLFAAAGVKFEDVRLKQDEWEAHKKNTKFGKLPELEIDGKAFSQSRAILFYLGQEFGFYPSNPIDKLAVEEIILFLEDVMTAGKRVARSNEGDKEKNIEEFKEKFLAKDLSNLDKIAKINGDNGFLVGSKLTLADIAFFDATGAISEHLNVTVEEYPSLQKVRNQVEENEGIQNFLKERLPPK